MNYEFQYSFFFIIVIELFKYRMGKCHKKTKHAKNQFQKHFQPNIHNNTSKLR